MYICCVQDRTDNLDGHLQIPNDIVDLAGILPTINADPSTALHSCYMPLPFQQPIVYDSK